MSKLSVIIPAYNAEKTVERTVRSVMASNISVEVFVTNDGSTDGTPNILDRLALEFPNLHVLHQSNCGAYQARLNALKHVKTKYFGFADADDTVEADMYEKMVSYAEKENLDVVQCGYDIWSQTIRSKHDSSKRLLNNRREVYSEYIYPKLLNIKESSFIWDKIYRNQYDFGRFDPTNHVTNFDDMLLNLQFFLKVEKMGFIEEPLYHYSMTEGSAVHSFNEAKVKDFCEAIRVRAKFLPDYELDAKSSENREWLRLNRMNCIKSTILASNLSLGQKMRIIWKLLKVREQ